MACLGLLAVVVPAGSADAASSCASLKPIQPSVELTLALPRQPVIRAAARAEIERRAGAASGSPVLPAAITRGVTLTQLEARAEYTLAEMTFSDRRKCVALRSIEARLGYTDLTVLIDRRYRQGGCEYNAVLDHEMQHVRINKDAVRGAEDAFRRELDKVAARWEGRWVSPGEAKRIDSDLSALVSDTLGRVRTEAKRRNARLDTPASYAAVQKRCTDW